MTFVNEYIPEADKKKYQITDQSNFYRAGASQWTVDREREMFLVYRAAYGPEGPQDQKFWAFYWRGHLLDVQVQNMEVRQDSDGNVHSRKRIIQINGMSPELEQSKPQILEDLRGALSVYGVAGLLIPVKSYELELEAR